MTLDEACEVVADFIQALHDAEFYPEKRSYQQDREEFISRMIAALQYAPRDTFI